MKVAFDFDDVLIDFVGAYLDALNQHQKTKYERKDIKLNGWDMSSWCSRILGLKEGSDEWLEWFRTRMGYWHAAEQVPGMLGLLSVLSSRGHQLQLVTSKPYWARTVVWAWLRDYNPPINTVHINDHYGKEWVSDADILVDDRPYTVRAWEASREDRLGILFARSQNAADRKGLVVAETAEDILRIIEWKDEGLVYH